MTTLTAFTETVLSGKDLSRDDAAAAFLSMMKGGATPAQMAAFLVALRAKGESVSEITGAAMAIRARMTKIHAPANVIDTCGTGGDASGTFNISTAAAFVVAGCGVPVAKHGNRAISSRSGSADVLKALGVNIEARKETMERALAEAGICFLMAPQFHAAMRHIAPVRVELGIRTIFNLLGPLANPAEAKRQVIGVYDRRWVRPLAEVLKELGSVHAWVVHGADGLDELTTTGVTYVAELTEDGSLREFEITPEDAGLERTTLEKLKGGDSHSNARALQEMLGRALNPYRDIVLLNAAAALIVAGKAKDVKKGVALAAESVDSGRAKEALAKLVYITGEDAIATE